MDSIVQDVQETQYLTRREAAAIMEKDLEKFLTRREADVLTDTSRERSESQWENHEKQHLQEREAVRLAMAMAEQFAEQHSLSHAQMHDAHSKVHEDEQLAVTTALANVDKGVVAALEAVGRERSIHADAHQREHLGHQREHELDKLAITKAEQANEIRFTSVNEFRGQLGDQSKSFATLTNVEQSNRETDRRIEDMGKQMFERYEANRQRIENLEKGDVKSEGKTLGQGTIVAIIVGAIVVICTILGILLSAASLVLR